MPDWHKLFIGVAANLVPVLLALAVFFLRVRTRIDRMEVRMDKLEGDNSDIKFRLVLLPSKETCAALHGAVGQAISGLQSDVRELRKEISDWIKEVRRNGTGPKP